MADEVSSPRIDVQEVLQGYSRKLLHNFREGSKALAFAFDRGASRETAVREFLAARLPGRYGVGEGIVVDALGGQSRQCDVVIHDRERTPILSTESALSIWPFEFAYGVVEVKSMLTKKSLAEAVENVAAFKRLSRPINRYAGRGGGVVPGPP